MTAVGQGVKIGLALGGGAARGLAHIGVLQVLEEEGVPIDYLAGTSMGALIAALYASGHSADMIARLARGLRRQHWMDLKLPGMGLIAGEKIQGILNILCQGKNIEDLDKPLGVVATDLETGEEVVLTRGSLAAAVRASIAIPGIFAPVRIDGRLLVDGGVLDQVPVGVVRRLGADIVVGVNVSATLSSGPSRVASLFDVILQSYEIMAREILRLKIAAADIIIEPRVQHISGTHFTRAPEFIAAGAAAAREALPAIRSLLEERERKISNGMS